MVHWLQNETRTKPLRQTPKGDFFMRNLYSLNQGWTLSFPKGERETETVNLPHT